MAKNYPWGVFCVAVLGLVVTFSAVSVDARAETSPIKIGWLSSLTGPLSSAAIAENQGVQFAIEEINKAGGIDGRKIELLTRDTTGDPTKAVNLANQLIYSEKVDFIIGPVNSGEALATVPIIAKAGIPNIIIAVVDELIDPKKYPRAFRAISTNDQWIRAVNDYALNALLQNMVVKKVAMFGDTTGYGTSSAKRAEALLGTAGVKPVFSVLIEPNKTDLNDEMNKARAAGAHVIIVWSAATGLLARILNTRGDMQWDVPVIGHPSLLALPIKNLLNKPEYWEKVYGIGYKNTSYGPDGKIPEPTKKLLDAMRQTLGNNININFWWVAMGYDTVQIIKHAVKTARSTDPAAIQKVLESTNGLKGVFTTYSWTPTEHNGFPDFDTIINKANTFRDGAYELAPR